MNEEAEPSGFFTLLREKRDIRRFLIACAQSQIGSGAAYAALILIAYQRLHFVWAISIVLLADFLPGIFTSFIFGGLADRWPRRRLIVSADLIRCVAFIAIAVLPWFSTTIVFALLAGVGTALFSPTANATLPTITSSENRNLVMSVYGGIQNSMMLIGPAIAALLFLFTSPSGVLLLNAATFLISALLLARTDLGNTSPQDKSEEHESLHARLRSELKAVHQIKGMTALITLSGLLVLAAGMMNVAEPLLAKVTFHSGNSGYALLLSSYGLGLIISSALNARGSSSIDLLRKRWLVSIPITGMGMFFSAISPTLLIAALAFIVTGFGNTMTITPEVRLMQEMSSDSLLGKVFGLRDTAGNVAIVIAFIIAGALVSVLGVRAVFVIGGGLTLLLLPIAATRFRLGTE